MPSFPIDKKGGMILLGVVIVICLPIILTRTSSHQEGPGHQEAGGFTGSSSASSPIAPQFGTVQENTRVDAGQGSDASQSLRFLLSKIQACAAIENEQERSDCYETALSSAEARAADLLGSAICGGLISGSGARSLIVTAMKCWSPGEALATLDSFRKSCPGFSTDDLIAAAVAVLASESPERFALLQLELTPEFIFDSSRGRMGVRLAGAMLKQANDGYLGAILDQGAQGLHGGTGDQIDDAILQAVHGMTDGQDILGFVSRVRQSPQIQVVGQTSGIGSSLMVLLLNSEFMADCSTQELVSEMHHLLGNPSIGQNAARQLVKYHSRDKPLNSFSQGDWAQIWDYAFKIADLY